MKEGQSTRMTYLGIGQARPGLFVASERSGNAIRIGHITDISPAPERRRPRPRICTVRTPFGPTWRELETKLLTIVGPGR